MFNNKQQTINQLGLNVFSWSLDSLLEFVKEKLYIENGEYPGDAFYDWSIAELMQYAFEKYVEEISTYSEATLDYLKSLSSKEGE